MRVVISGASGLVGLALAPALEKEGHSVLKLVRRRDKRPNEIFWDPEGGSIDAAGLDAAGSPSGAVIHLAGENIAGGRWSAEQKRKIRESRVKGTQLLAGTLAGLKRPPKVLVCASAIGYYGHRGEEVLKEESPPGTGFLAEVCQEWEASAEPAVKKGIRVCFLRLGIVLSSKGGALQKMLPPFKLGVGGVLGDGRQYWSWIAIEDVVGAILHCLNTPDLKGPVNGVSPQPVTNREFTKALGRALHRPTMIPMPAFGARMLLGEMADALLLASTRVVPSRLEASGYRFHHSDLDATLRGLLRQGG